MPWLSAKSELGTKRSVLTPNQLFLPSLSSPFRLIFFSHSLLSTLFGHVAAGRAARKDGGACVPSPPSRVWLSSAAVTARKLTISSSAPSLFRDSSREERRGTGRLYRSCRQVQADTTTPTDRSSVQGLSCRPLPTTFQSDPLSSGPSGLILCLSPNSSCRLSTSVSSAKARWAVKLEASQLFTFSLGFWILVPHLSSVRPLIPSAVLHLQVDLKSLSPSSVAQRRVHGRVEGDQLRSCWFLHD